MSRVVVAGGSVAGLAAALALAGHGRRVTILERGGPPPEGSAGLAGERWSRPTVPSWRHAHTLPSLGVSVLFDRAPQVIEAAQCAGAVLLDLVRAMPPHPPGRMTGDEELVALACRRPTLELVLYRIVRELPGVEIRHGVRVTGLTLSTRGTRGTRVTGVEVGGGAAGGRAAGGGAAGGGDRIPAEIVLDATGRRAEARSWLAAAGIELPADQTRPSHMRVFSRFYRRRGELPPLNRGNAAGLLGEHYAGVLHPGDDGTFSVALGVLPEDRMMHSLRGPAAFTAAAMATPGVAEWLGAGMSTPISGIRPITCPPNLLRALATSSPQPVAGLFPVGDAACVTNPLYGRGISLALRHAFRLADVLAVHPEPGALQSEAAAELAREVFTPWYQQAAEDDADRIARWRAAIRGEPRPPDRTRLTLHRVGGAAVRDAVIWRGLVRVLMGLQPPAKVFDVDFAARVRRALGADPPRSPAPTRAEFVAAVTGGGR